MIMQKCVLVSSSAMPSFLAALRSVFDEAKWRISDHSVIPPKSGYNGLRPTLFVIIDSADNLPKDDDSIKIVANACEQFEEKSVP